MVRFLGDWRIVGHSTSLCSLLDERIQNDEASLLLGAPASCRPDAKRPVFLLGAPFLRDDEAALRPGRRDAGAPSKKTFLHAKSRSQQRCLTILESLV